MKDGDLCPKEISILNFDGCYFIGFLIPKSCQEDPTVQLAKAIKICEKCDHGEATYYTKQTREGEKVFYTCASCDHEFQEYT
ncbi:hypothetical protein P8452_51908 [Trifolium repens]|nr:hypothetical protein P8452_51908 [Trifolium repens]